MESTLRRSVNTYEIMGSIQPPLYKVVEFQLCSGAKIVTEIFSQETKKHTNSFA